MKPEIKKLLILNAPYLLFVYLFDIRAQLRAEKERAAQKKTVKAKNHELEV